MPEPKYPLPDQVDRAQQFDLAFTRPDPLMTPDEIYSSVSHQLLKRLEEDRRIERKPAGIHANALGDYFSLWANTVPDGGIVVLGIENDGRITGCSHLPTARLNDLERAGAVYCPEARYECKRIPAANSAGKKDFLLIFRIYYHDSKVVETVSGEAFTRLGESRKKLTVEEVRELQIDKGQTDLEQEPCRLVYPGQFDAVLIRKFADAVRLMGHLGNHTDEEILEHRRLGKRRGSKFMPNIACALLFSNDPVVEFPGCKIRFLRFDGEWEGTGESFNAVKDRWIEGCVPSIIVGAEKLIESQLREFSRLGSDGKFYTAPEYPKAAWYEAIVNACVHRSYGLRNMNIFVKMFDDRLVIESPGPFPPFVTPENIYDSHHPRNPHLMNAMYFLDFVKCANEGTRRIRDTMATMNLPVPEFEQKRSGHAAVRVTLRNNIKQRRVWIDFDASTLVSKDLIPELGQDDHRAINFAAEHGSVNVSQLQRLTGRSWKSAKRLLTRLAEKKVLHHVHHPKKDRDPDAHYVLKPPKPPKKVKTR